MTMVLRIARRELLSNLMTLRFAVGTLLFLVLAVLFTCILLGDYGQKLHNYDALVARNSEELRELMIYQNLKPTIHKSPEVLAIFGKGVVGRMGNSYRISIGEVPELTGSIAVKNRPYSTDPISGMLTLMIPLFVGVLLSLIIVGFFGLSLIDDGQWVKALAFAGLSILYLSTFVLLGILVSSRSAKPSSSIVILLFLWVIIAMIIPSTGMISTSDDRIFARRFLSNRLSRPSLILCCTLLPCIVLVSFLVNGSTKKAECLHPTMQRRSPLLSKEENTPPCFAHT
jgi:hypothetical protein